MMSQRQVWLIMSPSPWFASPTFSDVIRCALCLHEKEIKASHLIPRFVGKWIKDTSATGFLTGAEKPEQRLQDLPTCPLLCSDCEEKFSVLETYFANTVFYPFLNENIRSFDYDYRLQLFILSLSWRILKTDYAEVVKDAPYHGSVLNKAEAEWRNFLLQRETKIEPYENHLFFLEGRVDGKLPEKFDWYVSSGCDTTIAGNGRVVLAYTKLPWMILVTSVHPTHLDGC